MTLDTAARFGIEISQRDYEEFYIPGRQRYRSTYFSIEGDWSAAAMLLVAGATGYLGGCSGNGMGAGKD